MPNSLPSIPDGILSQALHIVIALVLEDDASMKASTASALSLHTAAYLLASSLAALIVSDIIELRQSSMSSGISSCLSDWGLLCSHTTSLPVLMSLIQLSCWSAVSEQTSYRLLQAFSALVDITTGQSCRLLRSTGAKSSWPKM